MTAAFLAAAVLLGGCAPARAGFLPDSPFSDRARGSVSAVFLKLPAGARAEALGASLAAAADNAEAVFWNPAGLARMAEYGRSEAAASYNALLEGSYSGSMAYARPIAIGGGILGAGLAYFSPGEVQGYTALGDPAGSFKPYDAAFLASYARKFLQAAVGVGLEVIRSEVPGASGAGFALNLGVQSEHVTEVGEGPLDFGASVSHLGPPMRIGGGSDPLPMKLQLGVDWHISPGVQALLDGHVPVDQAPYPSLGVEAGTSLGESARASVRGGYSTRTTGDLDGFAGFSAGVGLGFGRLRLDYAWVPFGDLGSTNRVSIGMGF